MEEQVTLLKSVNIFYLLLTSNKRSNNFLLPDKKE